LALLMRAVRSPRSNFRIRSSLAAYRKRLQIDPARSYPKRYLPERGNTDGRGPPDHPPTLLCRLFRAGAVEDWRYEYIAGEVFAMTGGSEAHALIAKPRSARQRPARQTLPGLRSGHEGLHRFHDKFCYPDVTALCEQGTAPSAATSKTR
jgi:hypothetical protein